MAPGRGRGVLAQLLVLVSAHLDSMTATTLTWDSEFTDYELRETFFSTSIGAGASDTIVVLCDWHNICLASSDPGSMKTERLPYSANLRLFYPCITWSRALCNRGRRSPPPLPPLSCNIGATGWDADLSLLFNRPGATHTLLTPNK